MKMMSTDMKDIIYKFEPISLGEMDKVQLMNRTDTKYIFPLRRLPEILDLAQKKYKVLEIKYQRDFSYDTTYLDTCNFLFFYHQTIGKLQRHKVRFRIYKSSGISYLEVKRKTNKNRTIKWRIVNQLKDNGCDPTALDFLKNYVPASYQQLQPVLTNKFNRITLVGLETLERITLDYSISFSDWYGGSIDMPFLAIAEVKREGFSNYSPFIHILKQFNIRQTGFSKYCIGSAMLYKLPHQNILKQKFLLLNKIENEHNSFYNK
jgi:hypothetical protein